MAPPNENGLKSRLQAAGDIQDFKGELFSYQAIVSRKGLSHFDECALLRATGLL